MTLFNRGDKIRTCGLYVPNVALYQTEPHLENKSTVPHGSPVHKKQCLCVRLQGLEPWTP